MSDNEILKDYLRAEHGEQDDYYDREVGVYHASTLGNCVRRNYFDFVRDPDVDESAYPHFTIGNVLEEVFEDALKERHGWRYVKNALPIRIPMDDYVIVGETDPVVMDHNGDIERLWEVKTTGNLKYVRDEPKQEHLYQVHSYMFALDIIDDRCSIVYINKYNLETVTHTVQFDHEIWNDIVRRCERLHEALVNEDPPDPVGEDGQDYFCPHDNTQLCCKVITDD